MDTTAALRKSPTCIQTARILAFFLVLCGDGTRALAAKDKDTAAMRSLGKIVYLPNADLDLDHSSDPVIFDVDHLHDIAKVQVLNDVDLNSRWFDNSDDFRASIAADMGITGSRRGVELTVSSAFITLTGHKNDVKAVEVHASTLFSKTYVERGPELYKIPLRKDFIRDFESLPSEPEDPHTDKAWGPFQDFMKKWGSHIVSAAYSGAVFQSWSTAGSKSNYKQWQMEAKACLVAEGLKGTALGVCAGYSELQRLAVSALQTVDTRRVKGGTAETRTELVTNSELHEDLLQKFLSDSEEDEQLVRYLYVSVWDLLIGRSLQAGDGLSDNVKRARALQAYYEGWTANTCPPVVTSGETNNNAQLFVAEYTRSQHRTGYYLCIRRCIGCHNYNYDCHWDFLRGGCRAYGLAVLKQTADARDFVIRASNARLGWFGCDSGCSWRPFGTKWSWKPSGCFCTDSNREEGCNYDYPLNHQFCDKYLKYKIIWSQHTLNTNQDLPPADLEDTLAIDMVTNL